MIQNILADRLSDLNGIAYRAYPLETLFIFKYNPAKTVWFPLAVSDELFLKAMIFSSAAHPSATYGYSEIGPELGSVINALNQRLESQAPESLSDTTLGAVTCLAILEVNTTSATEVSKEY